MKRYQEYKDSGIPWIGDTPVRWPIRKLKYSFLYHQGGAWGDEPTGDENDRICIRVADFNYPSLSVSEANYTIRNYSLTQIQKLTLSSGDLLIEKSGGGEKTPVGRVVLFDKEVSALFANFLEVIRTNHNHSPRFFKYVFSTLYSLGITSLYFYQTTGIQNLNVGRYLGEKMPIPPLAQQEKIADYLDKKTKAIDHTIADKENLISLLYEKRTVEITNAVTKGLVSGIIMKDSNIDWLGAIPAHWKILTNHQLFVERNVKCTKPDAVLLSVSKHLGVILQSQAEEMNLATVAPAETTEGYKVVRKGDLVMNIMRAKDGSYGISDYDGVISPAYCIYYTRQEANPQYLYYLFKTPMYMEIFKNYSTGIAEHRMRLYPVNFFKIPAVVPPLDEQNEIVAYLDKRVKDIDELITLTQQQIEKLKEYRQSIISEVVTGKVAVE